MNKGPLMDISSLRKLRRRGEALRPVASFPYSEDLGTVMVSPVYTCSSEQKIRDVAAEMSKRGVSSVVIVSGGGYPAGIMTERDILRKVVSQSVDTENTPILKVMTPNPFTLGPRDSIYRALSVLSSRRIKHLPIVQEGRVVGIVTIRQLLKLRYPEPMSIIEGVREAVDVEGLRKLKARLPEMAATKISMGVSALDVVVMISLINQDIQRRAWEFAIREVGEPPNRYCLFVTGSHGRMENFLGTDQDHGLIIADGQLSGERFDEYYAELTRTFSEWLAEIGFPQCPGYVMSVNPTWRKSLFEWKLQVQYWFDRQEPVLCRYATALYDAAPLHGDRRLFEDMMNFAYNLRGAHPEMVAKLGGEGRPKKELGSRLHTGRSGPHKGEVDIKHDGLWVLVDDIRRLALARGITGAQTAKRLNALVDRGGLHPEDGEYADFAYRTLLGFVLNTQAEKAVNGLEVDSFLEPASLSRRELEMLRHAMKAAGALREIVERELGAAERG